MKLDEMPENVRKFVDFCLDDLNSPCSLHIESNGIQWECFVEDLKDWMENLDRKMLFDVEKVDAEEVNFGFTFRAVSRDGTVWVSEPCDCHKFAHGEKVGRFLDASGRLVIVLRK